MGRFVLRRLIQMIPLLIGITIITFALANLVPGSPVSNLERAPKTCSGYGRTSGLSSQFPLASMRR